MRVRLYASRIFRANRWKQRAKSAVIVVSRTCRVPVGFEQSKVNWYSDYNDKVWDCRMTTGDQKLIKRIGSQQPPTWSQSRAIECHKTAADVPTCGINSHQSTRNYDY